MAALPTASVFLPLKSKNVLIVTILSSLSYILVQVFTLNFKLIESTLLGSFPLIYKLRLMFDIFLGYFTMFPLLQLSFSLLTALLVGVNFALLIALMQRVKKSGDMKMSFGGTSVLALASSGCPSCGLTIFSLLGPSSGLIAVTMHSLPVQLGILGVLVLSSIVSLKRLQSSRVCKR